MAEFQLELALLLSKVSLVSSSYSQVLHWAGVHKQTWGEFYSATYPNLLIISQDMRVQYIFKCCVTYLLTPGNLEKLFSKQNYQLV